MKCTRCGGILRAIDVYTNDGKTSSWACYRCGEVVDLQILINRGVIRAQDCPPVEDRYIEQPRESYPSFSPRYAETQIGK